MFSIGDVSDIVRTAGYLLLLALAAQGLLELIIVSYSVRGGVVASAALSAVRQAAREQGVQPDELAYLVRRLLSSMGLGGLRVGALRVDHLTPEQLEEVIAAVDPSSITSLAAANQTAATARLHGIASRAQAIYSVAQGSFGERYKRRLLGIDGCR